MNLRFTPRAIATAFVLLLCLAASAFAKDVIRFKNGREVSGKIIRETKDSVTIQIEGAGPLTVSRDEIAEILKDVSGKSSPVDQKKGLLKSEQFFVWNGRRRVGTRSVIVRKLPGGKLSLESESEFFTKGGKKDVDVRVVETVTSGFDPIGFVYREITSAGSIVREGHVKDGTLYVTDTGGGKSHQSFLELPDGVRFPLAAREFAIRERNRLKGEWDVQVYDPAEQNFFLYRYESAGVRRVDWEGAAVKANVLRRRRGDRPWEEIWIDPAGEALTEELNGSALVAVKTTRKRIEAFLAGQHVATSKEERRVRPLFVDPEAGFEVRKPGLSWSFQKAKKGTPKVLTIKSLRYFAYVDVFTFSAGGDTDLVSSLEVNMVKRFSASSKDFKKVSEGFLEVGGEKAVEVTASSTNKGEDIRSLLVAFRHGKTVYNVAMACPTKYFKAAKPAFEAILKSIDFL